jgi:AhpD family alkylhydroperoxidase
VMLAVSAFHGCHYCTAAHRTAAKMMGIAQSEIDAIDALQAPADARVALLVSATWALQEGRGRVDADALGLSREDLYEVIAIIGLKTITNFINYIAGTQVDAPFVAQATRAHRHVA